MNHSEERLTKAFRNLADTSQRSASPETGTGLKDAFRRHHARRRRMLRLRVAALLICVSLPMGLLVFRKTTVRVASSTPPVSTVAMAPPLVEVSPALTDISVTTPQNKRVTSRTSDFVQLASFDSTISTDDLRLVRVEMPASALRLVGAPIHETLADRRVLADFLVGQDGTAYAVRLVR